MTELSRTEHRRPAHVDRRDAWRAFAEAAGGEMEVGKRPSDDRILLRHGPWLLVLETYAQSNGQAQVTYTRVRAYFGGYQGLRLTVRRRNLFDRLWSALGFGNPLPARPELLERFVVKGDPATRVPSLLSSSEVLDAARAAESFHLYVKRPGRKSRKYFGADAGVVVCQAYGVVQDPRRLGGFVRLVRELLDALRRVGAADDTELPEP